MAVIFKCKMCGADLDVKEGQTVCTCESCETMQTVPSMDNEEKINMFRRANEARFRCDYEAAANLYNGIAAKFPAEAEAYWGLCLCRYGIEYVEDGGERIPTCHRTSYEKIFDDPDYKKALDNADASARSVYKSEAKEIDRLQSEILKIVENEKPYDIFICYKETADNGGRTEDSVLAQDIYAALTAEGYKVFFSRITLEDKLGTEYEPYIFSALYTSKVMLVVGTKTENINAVWVKNEWSRFLTLMKKDKNKHLYPCYKYISPSELPAEMAMIQGKNIGEIGAVQDLVRNIGKVIPLKKENEQNVIIQQPQGLVESAESLLERVFEIYLPSYQWKEAYNTCEKVLNAEPKNSRAYFGKLMAELEVSNESYLIVRGNDFEYNDNFKNALKYATGKEKEKYQILLWDNIDYIGRTLFDNQQFDEAKDYFERIKGQKNYSDAEEMIKKCDEEMDHRMEGIEKFKNVYRKYDISLPVEHAYEAQQYIDKRDCLQKKYKFFPQNHTNPKWVIWFFGAAIGTIIALLINNTINVNNISIKNTGNIMIGCVIVYIITFVITAIVFYLKKTEQTLSFIGYIFIAWFAIAPSSAILGAILGGMLSISFIVGVIYSIIFAGTFLFFAIKAMKLTKNYNAELQNLNNIYYESQNALNNALSAEYSAILEKYPDINNDWMISMQNHAKQNYRNL